MSHKHYPVPMDVSVPISATALIRMMVQPFKFRLGMFFLLSFFGVMAWMAAPYIISQIVNELARTGAITSLVWTLAGFYAVILILDETLWRSAEFLMRGFKPVMIERIRTILFTGVLRKSYSFFVSASSGRIGHWINETTTTTNELVDTTIWTVWGRITGLFIAAGFLFYSHWMLGVLFVTWLVLLFALTIYRGRTFSKLVAHQSDVTSQASGTVVDSMSNHMSVRVFNARKREYDQLTYYQDKIIHRWRASWWQNLITNIIKGWSSIIANTTALAIILFLYSQGEVQLGDIVLFIAYFGDASSSLWQLAWAFDSYFRNIGTIQNALDGLQGDEERSVPETGHPPKTAKLSLELVDLSFAYTERPEAPVVKDLNLHIKAGEKIGVVGHSGAGKSTLIGLLLGLYEPTTGDIRINGNAATDHDPSYIRSMMSFIPQDTNLFNRSIRDNISYARPNATDDELINALKLAQAYDFVKDMPDGLDTIIGERGVKLSGGQRQRIAIARAILHDTPLIIMDEATSALDSVSEQAIQKAFHQVMKKRTSIVVAHRLSTLKHLDRIIVLDKGHIKEVGSHEALIKLDGVYADLWKRQKDGFIVD